MRKIMERQLKIGQVCIKNIEIDLKSRDEIPQLLLGLQTIFCDDELRGKVFKILEHIVPVHIDSKNGRPGMELWKILVLGTLRLNCNWDYDKVQNIANEHRTIRQFMGHEVNDFDNKYALQTIKDNVALLTPEILNKINVHVVNKGHEVCGCNDKTKLKGRCDSVVVKTDVHYPTDINLLLDAIRRVIVLTARESDKAGLTLWRQSEYHLRQFKKLFNRVIKLKRSKSKARHKKLEKERLITAAHQAYINEAEKYLFLSRQTLNLLQTSSVESIASAILIDNFIGHAERQIEQIRRRVIGGETILHNEKVFSIFEPHTEWIVKGKAGITQELGLKVCLLEDQYGFILHHHVMEKQSDDQVAVPMVAVSKKNFPNLDSCSFDKGFHSPDNQIKLNQLIRHVVLPKKGRLSQSRRQVEYSPEFVDARRKHSAVESAINALENHGLDRCPDHGIYGFKRYVALSVLARNIQQIGAKVREKRLKRQKQRKRLLEKQKYRMAA